MHPDVTILSNVSLSPFRRGPFGTQRYHATASVGPIEALGPLLISSRAHYPLRQPGRPLTTAEIPGQSLWGGVFYAHFGHFITEFLPKLLSLQSLANRYPDAQILTLPAPDALPGPLPAHVLWFLSNLGIDPARLVLCSAASRIEQLLVAPTPFAGRFRYHPRLLPLIDAAPWAQVAATGDRLFLSRSQLSAKARVLNIAEIEQTYADAGYRVIHPEALSLNDQIAQICGARAIAGENGSALHWALYSRHLRQVHALGWALELQKGIALLRGQTCQSLRAPLTGWLQARAQTVPLAVVKRALQG